jgi:tetratricopeptide (TPR) repeat protein
LACFDRVIAINARFAAAHTNQGTCLEGMARYGEALGNYESALSIDPDEPETDWNLAVNRLRLGDLRRGWIESEWRFSILEIAGLTSRSGLERSLLPEKLCCFTTSKASAMPCNSAGMCRYSGIAARKSSLKSKVLSKNCSRDCLESRAASPRALSYPPSTSIAH